MRLVEVLKEKKVGIVAHFYMDPEVRAPTRFPSTLVLVNSLFVCTLSCTRASNKPLTLGFAVPLERRRPCFYDVSTSSTWFKGHCLQNSFQLPHGVLSIVSIFAFAQRLA